MSRPGPQGIPQAELALPASTPTSFPTSPSWSRLHSSCQSLSCTFRAGEVTRNWSCFLQMPRLTQTQS